MSDPTHEHDARDEAAPGGLAARLRSAARAIAEDVRGNGGAPLPMHGRDLFTMTLASALLTLFYYYAKPSYYRRHLSKAFIEWSGVDRKADWVELLPYAYWALASSVLRLLVPLAVIVWLWRESPRDYGFGMWKRGHGKFYGALYLLMLPVLAVVSTTPSFQSKYPFYKGAAESWWQFACYELAYGVQFAALEAFFRGFLVFALFKRFGYHAVTIMTIPYCMIHFNKPVAETLGAIVAGYALGYAALKSRSWWPGALLHWSIGFTMDVLCIAQKGG